MSLEISPIADAEMDAVASFLHRNLNNRLSVSEWLSAMSAPWKADAPNSGFMLRDGERVVGVYLAFYSERTIAGRTERFCNLASWAVHKDFRVHSVRLLKALLAQDGYHFTDLGPSGNVDRPQRPDEVPFPRHVRGSHSESAVADAATPDNDKR